MAKDTSDPIDPTAAPKSAAHGMIDRANRMYKRSNYCSGPSCEAPHSDWSRDAVDTEMQSYVQLMRLTADLSHTYYFGDPFSP